MTGDYLAQEPFCSYIPLKLRREHDKTATTPGTGKLPVAERP